MKEINETFLTVLSTFANDVLVEFIINGHLCKVHSLFLQFMKMHS